MLSQIFHYSHKWFKKYIVFIFYWYYITNYSKNCNILNDNNYIDYSSFKIKLIFSIVYFSNTSQVVDILKKIV